MHEWPASITVSSSLFHAVDRWLLFASDSSRIFTPRSRRSRLRYCYFVAVWRAIRVPSPVPVIRGRRALNSVYSTRALSGTKLPWSTTSSATKSATSLRWWRHGFAGMTPPTRSNWTWRHRVTCLTPTTSRAVEGWLLSVVIRWRCQLHSTFLPLSSSRWRWALKRSQCPSWSSVYTDHPGPWLQRCATHWPTCSTNCYCWLKDLWSAGISTFPATTTVASTRRWTVCYLDIIWCSMFIDQRTRPVTCSTLSSLPTLTTRVSPACQVTADRCLSARSTDHCLSPYCLMANPWYTICGTEVTIVGWLP